MEASLCFKKEKEKKKKMHIPNRQNDKLPSLMIKKNKNKKVPSRICTLFARLGPSNWETGSESNKCSIIGFLSWDHCHIATRVSWPIIKFLIDKNITTKASLGT